MSQTERIREHFEKGLSLTPLEALNLYGCLRLGARVWDLKRQGVPIDCDMVETPTGKRVAEYRLASGQLGMFAA